MRRLLYLTVLWLVASLPALGKTVTVAGTFQTSFGDKEIVEMILEQDGDKVTGKYAFNNGKIDGNLEGRKLTGRWTEDGASGRFEFEFSRDGRSFEGLRTNGDVQPTSESDSWDGVMTESKSKSKSKSGKKGPEGCWTLVDKETFISRPTFTIDKEIVYESDRSVGKVSYVYTLSGTAENFTIRIKCDYHHTYEWEHLGFFTDNIVFDVTEQGGFEPLEGPYADFATVYGSIVCKQKGVLPDDLGYYDSGGPKSILSVPFPYASAVTSVNIGGFDGVSFAPGDYKHVFDTRYIHDYVKDGDDAFFVRGDKVGRFTVTMPAIKYNQDYGKDGYICLEIRLNHEDNTVDYIATVYHFRWEGEMDAPTNTGYSEPAGWFRDIFGNDEHTDDLWTIFISGGAGALAVGAIAGALSGNGPSGGAPSGETPPIDILDDRKRRFFRDDDPDYVRRNIRENGDGSMTLTDPGGGPTQTLYPKYDEAGNRIGWFNQNFTEYDDEGLREWTRWRSENAEEFRKDTAQAERNVAEQRAMNEARDKADRERGSTQTADEVKQWEQHEAHMNKLADKFGIDRENEEALKKAIRRDMAEAKIEGAEAEGRAAWWDERIAEAELTEKVCDTIIDTVGEATPQTKAIKTQYHFFKTLGQRSMEGIVDNQGVGHTLLKTGQGLAEGTIDLYSGDDRWKNHGTLDKLTGGEKGRSVGSAVLKSVMGDLIDGDKDASEIIDNAVKSGVTQYGSDLMGDVIGDQVKDAELTGGATDAHREMVKNLGGEWLNEKITNPVSEEISGELNFWRKKFLGV